MKKKGYIPPKKLNPIVQAKKLYELRRDVDNHSAVLKSVISTVIDLPLNI